MLHPTAVTVCNLDEKSANWEDVVAMFVQASADSALCAATYLPAKMSAAQARGHAAALDGFVIHEDGVPAGVLIVHHTPHPGDGVELPPGCVEIERWVLPRFRDRGILRRAWPALAESLATRFLHLCAVCWEDNHAAARSLRACGFARLGRSFWAHGDESGWCEVFVYDLRRHRTPPAPCDASGGVPPR